MPNVNTRLCSSELRINFHFKHTKTHKLHADGIISFLRYVLHFHTASLLVQVLASELQFAHSVYIFCSYWTVTVALYLTLSTIPPSCITITVVSLSKIQICVNNSLKLKKYIKFITLRNSHNITRFVRTLIYKAYKYTQDVKFRNTIPKKLFLFRSMFCS